jgi:hypothetical protein
MTGSESDVQRWRTWIRQFTDSLPRVDGESGLEFFESAGRNCAAELKQRQPETGTVSELIVAGLLVALQMTGAEAYVDLQRPRDEIEQILRDALEDVYQQSESWTADGLTDDERAAKLAAYEVEIQQSNARVAEAVPEIRRRRADIMDFDDLLQGQGGGEARMVIFEIARVVSPELFAFMLNVPSASIHDHIPDETQREVTGELISLLRALPGYPYELASGAITDALFKYDSELMTSRATHFHIKCGGVRPEVVDDGSLINALQIVAMDFVGVRLRKTSSLMNVIASHPLHHQLIYRVMGEGEPIAEMFRQAANADTTMSEPEREMQKFYLRPVIAHWSDGSGGSIEIRHVPEAVLSSVKLWCDTSDDVLAKVCDAVAESLAQARRLATGEPAATVAFVGLANVTLDVDVPRIDLPGMVIRRPSAFEAHGVPHASTPTAIAEVSTELQMLDVALQARTTSDDPKERLREFAAERDRSVVHQDKRQHLSKTTDERILQLRFAIALASQQRRLIGPIWLYTVYRNPLSGWGGNSLRPSNDIDSAFTDQVIDRITADRIPKYFVPTTSLHASLQLARGRILQALSERSDPIDCFIDFVIAWESIVGYTESTTFLVSGAMSMLLSSEDAEKRQDLFSRIKKLYRNRSDLVHGSAGRDAPTKSSFKLAEARDYAEQAGRFAIDTFKRVLERPELMDLDAQERVRMVLLGFT